MIAQNCFLYCLLPTAVASAVGLQTDEIETKFLHANSILEFSHSLGHVWTVPAVQEESDLSAERSGAAMYTASHDGISVKSCCGQTVIKGGALISAGFPAKPHIRRELIPTTVPHSGRESSKRTAPLYIDGAAAPCRITATFPRTAGLLCVRSATRIAGPIRQQALRLRLQALHRR